MKNNTLSALVIFFAVVACLLILDDISHAKKKRDLETYSQQERDENQEKTDLTSVDLVNED